jgi:peptide-methionine (R)-S-oxide reductase
MDEQKKIAAKKKLNEREYRIMCNEGTEPAFQNEYWDNKRPGLYVDKLSGDILFSSLDKYDSHSGWPSFTKPFKSEAVTLHTDTKLFMERTEVKSSSSQAHLGHVFDDGPLDAGGKRYCMNSASLRFIPLEKLDEEGFGEYKHLFMTPQE